MPESSRYLVAAGHEAEALQVLQQGAKSNNAELPPGKLIASVQVSSCPVKYRENDKKIYIYDQSAFL